MSFTTDSVQHSEVASSNVIGSSRLGRLGAFASSAGVGQSAGLASACLLSCQSDCARLNPSGRVRDGSFGVGKRGSNGRAPMGRDQVCTRRRGSWCCLVRLNAGPKTRAGRSLVRQCLGRHGHQTLIYSARRPLLLESPTTADYC